MSSYQNQNTPRVDSDYRWITRVAAACALSTAVLISAPAMAASSGNLIVNGDAEVATCTTDWKAVTTVPGWTVSMGNPSVVCHSIANFGSPDATAKGRAFLADGPYGDSEMVQAINVASAAGAIDGGGVSFNLSGWLGGWTVYAGEAVVTANFMDTNGKLINTPSSHH